uniref:Uncharacterized protein n=1 Tax=Rangifer tarandus platyrhynchus TaxID=3082113 RepID=A0ACB0ESR4_RANTA|nr:unnamed protein product [Rangifer tarandus platyrhynchus]
MQQSGAPADLQRKLSKNRNKCVISPEGITSEGFNDTVKPFTGSALRRVLQPLPLDVTSRLHILCTDKVLLKRRGKRCTPRCSWMGAWRVQGLGELLQDAAHLPPSHRPPAQVSGMLWHQFRVCYSCFSLLDLQYDLAPRCAQATVITHLTCCRRPLSRVLTSGLGPLHLLVTLLDKRPFKMQADHITACFHGSHCSQMKDLAWTLISLLAVVRTTACSHVVISILLLPKALLPSPPKFG